MEEEWFKDHPKIAKLIKAIMQVTVLSFALKGITNIFGKSDEDKIATLQAEISEYKTIIKRQDELLARKDAAYKALIEKRENEMLMKLILDSLIRMSIFARRTFSYIAVDKSESTAIKTIMDPLYHQEMFFILTMYRLSYWFSVDSLLYEIFNYKAKQKDF